MQEVFISRPNWIPTDFEKGINGFYNLLKSVDLNPRTIGLSDYPNESPSDEVINLMKICKGTLVLGIPQIQIINGIIRGNELVNQVDLGTEWNHIEAALAYSIGHPLLIIHHKNIKRGIFDRGTCNAFIYEIDMTDPSWSLSSEISGVLKNWKSKLKDTTITTIKEKVNLQKPKLYLGMYQFEGEEGLFCPVCYTKKGLKMPCSRVHARLYKCPNCKAELSM